MIFIIKVLIKKLQKIQFYLNSNKIKWSLSCYKSLNEKLILRNYLNDSQICDWNWLDWNIIQRQWDGCIKLTLFTDVSVDLKEDRFKKSWILF